MKILLLIAIIFNLALAKNYRIDINNQILTSLKKEKDYNYLYSKIINGKTETKHYYKNNRFILVDIETTNEVIECGLDKRSSLDSIQQAGFFHI